MDAIPNQDQEESDNYNETDPELERLEGDNIYLWIMIFLIMSPSLRKIYTIIIIIFIYDQKMCNLNLIL